MSYDRNERLAERMLSVAVIAVFVAIWVANFVLAGPPEFPVMYFISAGLTATLSVPWLVATRLLWRAWSAALEPGLDGPSRLLTAAIAALPADRRDWGTAMTAELEHITGGPARWRFAMGCARTAIFPPQSNRVPLIVVAVAAIVSVTIAWSTMGYAFPPMRVFAVAFLSLVGMLAINAVRQRRRIGQLADGATIAISGIVGVSVGIGVTTYFLVKNPAAAEHFPPGTAVTLALLFAGCLWLSVLRPAALMTSRLARGVGIIAALMLGVGFFVTARMSVHTYAGPMIWIVFAPFLILFVASAIAACIERSFRAGVQAAVWTALVGMLLIFALSVSEAMHRFAIDGRTLADGESGYPIGVNLPGAVWDLAMVPFLGLPFGVIGAALGRRLRGPRPVGESNTHGPGRVLDT